MRWIVGVDVRPSSQGAIRFAKWLAEQPQDPGSDEFIGLHVLAHDEMMMMLRRHHLKDVLERARQVAGEAVASAGAEGTLPSVEIARTMTVEDSLGGALAMYGADAVIIGRHAGREAGALYRLGRVARRLLRTLPGPVVVTPSDLLASHLGDGPIVCAVTTDCGSLSALRFAYHLAERLRRSVHLLHASMHPLGIEQYIGFDDIGELTEIYRADAEARLSAWLREHRLPAFPCDIVSGNVVEVVETRAQALNSPLIVCGSRQLTTSQRIFQSSVGTNLAGLSMVPVAVVPPDVNLEADRS